MHYYLKTHLSSIRHRGQDTN